MKNLDDHLANHVPPPGIHFKTSEKKLDYFNEVIGYFVDKYVVVDPDKERNRNGQAVDNDDQTEQTDRVRLVYACMYLYIEPNRTILFSVF